MNMTNNSTHPLMVPALALVKLSELSQMDQN